ncbi:DegT/DnrJ/EryC1/StrS family aminotransferase [Amycolatopsis pithecellobii]|uniref:Aminotransferase n=1 Tax=Amycolatopsis pithecellobii TaxID=664692 RepID=A0A6N7Z129_9PSEU|nr:DegT/DnrJ/EryC1/StrS aminotransferase family protein [Amycolatopsis pithecellobii]MTD58028.1 aminotransferase [Amycolatopsis pithecellobii]
MTSLAASGGRPVRTTPLPSWPVFSQEEIAAAGEVLASGQVNYWTGNHGRKFEQEFAEATGTVYAVAVANGTVALELALGSLGIGPGDEVIVPAATFIATASAVVRCGATPVVVDVDLRTQCLTRETVEPRLSPATRAIVVVHLAGHPAEMAPLLRLARERSIKVVEDCAQAHGAHYFGQPVGSLGDVAAWSFCQDKILSTGGEGGAITTSDPTLWRRCWELKDHGKNAAEVEQGARHPGFRWLHDSFGTNARMTEMQAAIGRVQLSNLDTMVKHRQLNAGILLETLREHPAIRVEDPPAHVEHSYYRFYAHVRPNRLRRGWDRDRVVVAINAEGIPCGYGGCAEIYRERAFEVIDGAPRRLPNAAELGRTSLTLPVQPNLDTHDVQDMVAAVVKVLMAATA